MYIYNISHRHKSKSIYTTYIISWNLCTKQKHMCDIFYKYVHLMSQDECQNITVPFNFFTCDDNYTQRLIKIMYVVDTRSIYLTIYVTFLARRKENVKNLYLIPRISHLVCSWKNTQHFVCPRSDNNIAAQGV